MHILATESKRPAAGDIYNVGMKTPKSVLDLQMGRPTKEDRASQPTKQDRIIYAYLSQQFRVPFARLWHKPVYRLDCSLVLGEQCHMSSARLRLPNTSEIKGPVKMKVPEEWRYTASSHAKAVPSKSMPVSYFTAESF